VTFELVKKTLQYCDITTKQDTRKYEINRNGLLRDMIQIRIINSLKCRFVLMDS
jgi:hypothetical protein